MRRLIFPVILFICVVEGVAIFIAYKNYQSVQLNTISLHSQSFKNKGIEAEMYHTEVFQLFSLLRTLQFPLEPSVTPQSFQDKLCNRISLITTKTTQVKLPLNFYLGFDQYRSTLPPHKLAPELDRELEVIFGIVNQLIEIPLWSILAVHRFPVVEESSSHSSKKIQKTIFEICFVADQQAFISAFNAILRFPHFLSIEALQVINTHSQIPFKKEETTLNKEKMKRLFLKEKLTITLRIALFNFTLPEGNLFYDSQH